MKFFIKTKLGYILIGILISFIITTGIRFLTYKEMEDTHFHANVAIFINGQRVDLSKDKYMEPISACTVEEGEKQLATQRTHLHSNNPETVHVHDDGVLWGHFLTGIRFNVGKDYIVTDEGKGYQNADGKMVTYVLNGKIINNPSNYEIESQDRLLINYGSESQDDLLNNQFKQVSTNAKEYNEKNDPATCSGKHEELDFWEKLKRSLIN